MNFTPKSKITSACIAIATILFAYTVYRATTMSMTHDESSTFNFGLTYSELTCFFAAHCWQSANIHLLNSLLMKMSVSIFGTQEFFVRLPNVLAHLLYLSSSFLLLRRFSGSFWVVFSGFILLNMNAYMLDFFSVGRGYGLALAFMMTSYYFLFRWMEQRKWIFIGWCFFSASLAVLSNFVFIYFLAVLFGFFIVLLLGSKITTVNKEHFYLEKLRQPLLAGTLTTSLLAILVYVPIKTLRKGEDLGLGVDSILETLRNLVLNFLWEKRYFGEQTVDLLIGLSLLLLPLAIAIGVWKGVSLFLKGRQEETDESAGQVSTYFYLASSFLCLSLLLGLLLQYHLLGIKFLHDRKALILFPLCALPVIGLFNEIKAKLPRFSNVMALVLSSFMLFHFYNAHKLDRTREWWYDATTKDMILHLEGKKAASKFDGQIKLGVDWAYSHSARFYKRTKGLDFIAPIEYEKKLRKDTFYDYYYVRVGVHKKLHPDYVLDKRYVFGLLFRRKDME